jgi:hypothetical protein
MRQRIFSHYVFAAIALVTILLAGCGDFFVSSDTLVSITVTPQNPTVQPAKTQQFTATGTLGDGTTKDVSSQATWTSSNTNIATISNTGLASTVAVGNTTISAAMNDVTGSTTLTVSNQVISSIAITPANPTIAVGGTQQFVAIATLSDGTTSNVSSSVTWTSSNPAVATITNTGLASALTAGSTTITATSGSVTATTNLTTF